MNEEPLAIVTQQPVSLTSGASLQEVKKRINLIEETLRTVMKKDVHYGVIPGTGNKPTLLKPGAEMLCSLFSLGVSQIEKDIHDLGDGHKEYILTVTLSHYPTKTVIGQGVGSCSTMESKYRYRNTADYEILNEDIPGDAKARAKEYRKQGYGMKKIDGVWEWVKYGNESKTENPDIADIYNTCLKMSKKRSVIDAVLTATGASAIFTQDIEEHGPRVREDKEGPTRRDYQMDIEEKVYKVKSPVEPEAEREDVSYVWNVRILNVVSEPKGRYWEVQLDDLEHPVVFTRDKALAVKAAQWIEAEPVDITVRKGDKPDSWVLVYLPERPEGTAIIEESIEEEFSRKERQ